jgi:eukaryotic-like serine/threonine-protein kinase
LSLSISRSILIKNLIIAVIVTIVLTIVIGQLLKIYTHHSETVVVPNLIGLLPADFENKNIKDDFELVVIDSVFDLNKAKGSIAFQEPPSNSVVKRHRTIYLTLVATTPEKVRMPDLSDLTLRQASAVLETYGLKTGRIDYVANMAKNAVVRQLFKGRDIKSTDWILKGSSIDLKIGNGSGSIDGGMINAKNDSNKTSAEDSL